jgi:signal transduction histidine kinase
MSDPAIPGHPSRGLSRGELGLLALLAGLIVLTVLTAWLPELRFGFFASDVDLLINGISALIAGAAAWLSWLRHRHMSDLASVYQAAAFLLFAITASAQTMAALGLDGGLLGLDLDAPRQAPLYAWSVLRVVAGALLLRSAWLRLRRPAGSYRHAGRSIALALGGAGVIIAFLYAAEPLLPPLLGAEAVERLAAPGSVLGPLPGITFLELALQSIGVIMLGGAALAYALAARRGMSAADPFLAAGLLLAAVAQVHFALFPGVYTGLVTSSDILRLCFYGFVVVGIQADAGATLRELRAANRQLHELRDVELANASLAERARLARELHDGLAQHLWLARLTTDRLSPAASPEELAGLRGELSALLDAGLDEARQTVMALRDAALADARFEDVLARQVRRFGEQTGLVTRVNADGLAEVDLSPRSAVELLRITQEALTNVRKHADATTIVVEAERAGEMVRLSIRDNGVGFDPAADHPGYGLEAMSQRAAMLGGRLSVESSPLAGTTLRAEIPLAPGTDRAT